MEREARVELVYFCLEGRRVTKNTSPASIYLLVGPADRNRTWIYSLGENRSIHWTTASNYTLLRYSRPTAPDCTSSSAPTGAFICVCCPEALCLRVSSLARADAISTRSNLLPPTFLTHCCVSMFGPRLSVLFCMYTLWFIGCGTWNRTKISSLWDSRITVTLSRDNFKSMFQPVTQLLLLPTMESLSWCWTPTLHHWFFVSAF